ncbi:MAG: Asp-tRNA(Asn)/Glu-tRNA(Gln) amidotransferase subunit GatB, partial [Flammeovirgaceae bacterium]|nr:Asp-tRNA(Asn)/Glu-tRNA(Gln) amidotransferase subunit GatB [Flammeovirgaceae bacterium]
KSILDKYELVVGLETHAQLLTQSKAYSTDSTEFGQLPNTNISIVTLALPGTLPKGNKKVVEYAIKMGLACHCEITRYNIYDRKNYFYPDLPKGFQLTQDKTPICRGGYVRIKTKSGIERNIKLTRIHMEEDAGKSLHLEGSDETLVDLNRAGVPLIEIVSEPDIRLPEEAYAYLTELRRLVRYLDICDGNMEEGSMRCDANVSVRLKGETKLGKKVEVKNMNSIRNVQRAIEHEFLRQVQILENGGHIVSETRMFDAQTGNTYSLRTKENLNDYRYFPEPDLPPLIVSEEFLESIKASMPPLPHELYEKFTKQYGLPDYDAGVLTDEKAIALYFEEICQHTRNYKAASNWMMGPVKSYLNELTMSIERFPLRPIKIVELIELVDSNKISFSIASERLFPKFVENPDKTALQLAQSLNLLQESGDDFLLPLIEQAIAKFPEKAEAYRKGNKNLMGLFMGEVMRLSKGKADPKKTTELIAKKLTS